ncbi:MAG: hypothetical protein IPL63_04090 [Saprospiraceae bacterium]|nr:hypothetical protein [Saprospiraceae bacterium]MBK8081986.1 hypothetical protein [Saprospiraceae bacterium]MBK8370495.1 hypothetical protein [Saprospiraceae bacterium]MBK8546581.1 hypothetical protein [Saprospiraceae bacterium]MBK8817703.1 hypothetical protein [Saprospiraceae bacterium]
MKIKNITTVSRLKNGEFLQFMKNLIELCEKSDAPAMKLDKRLNVLQSAISEFEEVFQNSKAHILTSEIDACDEKRLNVMRAIRKILESFYIGDVDAKETASLLMNNFQIHSDYIAKRSIPQKTASMSAMYKDWTEDFSMKSAMENLGLTVWMEKLQKYNNECNDLYLKRVETTKQSGRITEKRIVIKSLFDDMSRDVEAHIRLSENKDNYIAFLQKVNVLLSRYTSIIKARSADRKKPGAIITSPESTAPM